MVNRWRKADSGTSRDRGEVGVPVIASACNREPRSVFDNLERFEIAAEVVYTRAELVKSRRGANCLQNEKMLFFRINSKVLK